MILEGGQAAFGMPSQADFFLGMGVEQAYNKPSRIDFRESQWQVLLPPAASWLLIAGKTDFSICLSDEIGNAERNSMKSDRWGGRRKVWSRNLWWHWKAQLQKLAVDCNVNAECRCHAARAVEKMTEVENDHQD